MGLGSCSGPITKHSAGLDRIGDTWLAKATIERQKMIMHITGLAITATFSGQN